MSIKELRSDAEFMMGVPKHIQRLRYLDKGKKPQCIVKKFWRLLMCKMCKGFVQLVPLTRDIVPN